MKVNEKLKNIIQSNVFIVAIIEKLLYQVTMNFLKEQL